MHGAWYPFGRTRELPGDGSKSDILLLKGRRVAGCNHEWLCELQGRLRGPLSRALAALPADNQPAALLPRSASDLSASWF